MITCLGGLNLPCLATMSDSLFTTQCVRLLRSGDNKAVAHLDYWIGSLVSDIFPGLGLGREAPVIHEYFEKVADCLALVMMSEVLTTTTVPSVRNKIVYKDLASFPTPKVELGSVHNYKLSWRRLQCPAVESEVKETMFLLIHNKLPVSERLFRIGVKVDPYCSHCPGAVTADIEHFFCDCERTKVTWSWIRLKILRLCQQGSTASNWELLHLLVPETQYEQEMVWLIGNFISYAWNNSYVRNRVVKVEKFFGFLTYKYKTSMLKFGQILGLD